jgi:hypothetical protein
VRLCARRGQGCVVAVVAVVEASVAEGFRSYRYFGGCRGTGQRATVSKYVGMRQGRMSRA